MMEIKINQYIDWIKEGRSFSDVRNDLLIRGLSENQITQVLNFLNERIIQDEIQKSKKSSVNQWRYAGLVLISISIALATYSIFITLNSIILTIGGFVTGLAMIQYSKRIQNGPSVFQRRIQKRRNY